MQALKTLAFAATLLGGAAATNIRGLDAPGAELRVSGDGVNHVDAAFAAANAILKESGEARALASATCAEEKAATEKWLAGGVNEDKDAAAARAASKAALHGALGNRIKGLLLFLKKLKAIRAKLYTHIERVNGIYGAKFEENMNYMTGAVQSLHALSVILTTPISPKLRPIKNFVAYEPPSPEAKAAAAEIQSVEADAGGAAAEEPADAAAPVEVAGPESTLFVEVAQRDTWEAQNMRFARLKQEEDQCCSAHNCPCSKGRQQAFELYEKSLELNSKMSVNFEAERKVLAAFREGLKKMIDSREANLAALQAQLSKLEAAMNLAEEPIQGLFKKMHVHLDVLGKACTQQATNAQADIVEMKELITLIKTHHVGEPGETGAAGAAAEAETPVADASAEAEAPVEAAAPVEVA